MFRAVSAAIAVMPLLLAGVRQSMRTMRATAASGASQSVGVGPAVLGKLPLGPAFLDQREIEVCNQQLIAVFRSLGNDLAARIDEVAGPVEVSDIPRGFRADAVDRSNVDVVGNGGSGLFKMPQMAARSSRRGGRIHNVLGAVQRQRAPSPRENAGHSRCRRRAQAVKRY